MASGTPGKPGGAGASPGPGAGGKSGAASPGPASTGAPGVAYVRPGPRPAATAVAGSDLDKLNARLGNLLPGGAVSEYAHGGRTGKLDVDAIPADFVKKVAPPPDVLRKAFALNYRRRTAGAADAVLYVTGKRHVLFDICSGWMVELHPLNGGPPQGFPYFGPCPSDAVVPAWASALPTLPPRPPAR